MAHAYTPGLKVVPKMLVRKERRLPLKGQVVVWVAGKVNAETIVAKTQLPGAVEPLNIAGHIGIPPEDVPGYLVKHPGESLKKGDVIAQTKGILGFLKTTVLSPIDGSIESISKLTGQAILRAPPTLVEINAYIDGVVTELFENEGVLVETFGAYVQGIFGIGGETNGVLVKVANNPSEIITPDNINDDLKGKIIIGGAGISYETIEKAVKCGCKGIIVGGIDNDVLHKFLGYEIGVAITGSEKKGITLIVTEGFGIMNMAERTYELLCENSGKKASINGATQIRAGVMRPEVIIPCEQETSEIREEKRLSGVVVGTKVRIIREPHFGEIGTVEALPSELQKIETGAKVRVFKVKLYNDISITLPRANVEMIEE